MFLITSFNGGGGGWIYPPPIFIYENNRKGNKIMHRVDFFFWVVVLKVWAFFTYFNLVLMEVGGLYLSITYR